MVMPLNNEKQEESLLTCFFKCSLSKEQMKEVPELLWQAVFNGYLAHGGEINATYKLLEAFKVLFGACKEFTNGFGILIGILNGSLFLRVVERKENSRVIESFEDPNFQKIFSLIPKEMNVYLMTWEPPVVTMFNVKGFLNSPK